MKAKSSKRRRLWFLVGLLVAVIVAVPFYISFFLTRPVGSGPAGPRVDRSHFNNIWSTQKVHVLGVGDSITAGLGAKSPSHTFFNRILQNPVDEFREMNGVCLAAVLPELTSHNYAISGSESATHVDVIQDTIPKHEDDVFGIVLMTTGGNDLIHMYGRSPPRECAMYGATMAQAQPWIASFDTRLRKMIASLQSKFPGGCEIYVGDIYDPTDGVGDAPSVFLPDWPDGLKIHAR